MQPPLYVVYDGQCDLCEHFKEAILHFDRSGGITPLSLEDPRVRAILPGLTEDRLKGSFHLVWPDGRVKSGPDAIPDLLRLLPLGSAVAWGLERLPSMGRVNRWLYRVIAQHRSRRP